MIISDLNYISEVSSEVLGGQTRANFPRIRITPRASAFSVFGSSRAQTTNAISIERLTINVYLGRDDDDE
ncbi:hypothetical protein IQ238_24295 [Pleurocapsales cyanobacterium LEGE 06147]|nr:hypothetical protein [Pleurocapsales cyanobacterium LEGE 06147]